MKKELRSDCPIGGSLDIFGDRWSLLIIRDAFWKGYRHYHEFESSPEQISTNILASRLQLLVQHGIFDKQKDPENKRIYHYTLTPKGQEIAPIMIEMVKWGAKHCEGTVNLLEKAHG